MLGIHRVKYAARGARKPRASPLNTASTSSTGNAVELGNERDQNESGRASPGTGNGEENAERVAK